MAEDKIQWVAIYNDGSRLYQIESDDKKNSYENIDRERLETFCLVNPSLNCLFNAKFDGDGKNLVWRRRVTRREGHEPLITHVIGKKGRYVALVTQDGNVHMFDNFNADEVLLDFPQAVRGEAAWTE